MAWPKYNNISGMICPNLWSMTRTITLPPSIATKKLERRTCHSTTTRRRFMMITTNTPSCGRSSSKRSRAYNNNNNSNNRHQHQEQHQQQYHSHSSHHNNNHSHQQQYHTPDLFAIAAATFVAWIAGGNCRSPIVMVADAQQTTANTIQPATTGTSENDADNSKQESNDTSIQGSSGSSSNKNDKKNRNCPFYGCPLLPMDIVAAGYGMESNATEKMKAYNYVCQKKYKELQNELSSNSSSSSSRNKNNDANGWWKDPIEAMWSMDDGLATTTMTGQKYSGMGEINQDRSIVVGPYRIKQHDGQTSSEDEEKRILLGVFDGHGLGGELFSEYLQMELPRLLATKLNEAYISRSTRNNDKNNSNNNYMVNLTKQVLIDTFIELDRTSPAEKYGGCTASVILKQGRKVYIANTGDSRSFLVIYRKRSKKTQIVYMSQDHKPHHPLEKQRIETAGGMVQMPRMKGDSARVLYFDHLTGTRNALAMSRSIGDFMYKTVGVIPDPTVDAIDLPELVQKQIKTTGDNNNNNNKEEEEDDIHVFAVAATDGMMDYTPGEVIAKYLAQSLFEDADSPHLLLTCGVLVKSAANRWNSIKGGRYRDDITIAVAKLRTPPATTTAKPREND